MNDVLRAADFDAKKKESVKPEYWVYKANPLLLVRDEMAIMQARFFTAYLCKVDPENPETYKATFSLSAFCQMLEVDTSNIKRLKADCTAIRKMGFDFVEYRRKKGEKIDPMLMDEISLFSRFAITGNSDDGYFVEVTPTREMEHLIRNSTSYGFVKYEAQNTLVLSNKKYMRMYEFLKRHEGKGVSVDVITLKAYLGLSEADYPKMKDFRRDVLDKGIREINEKTDINVSFETKNKGRGGKIVGFHFVVKPNKNTPALPDPSVADGRSLALSEEDIAEFNSLDGDNPLDGQLRFEEPDELAMYRAVLPSDLTDGQIKYLVSETKKYLPFDLVGAARDIAACDVLREKTLLLEAQTTPIGSNFAWLKAAILMGYE